MAEQFADESLAETHHFARAAALRIEVGAALAAAHWQGGQGILEGLLESQELEDREVDRRVEADAAFVRADGRGVLDAVAAIDLDLAMVVDPGDAEHDDPLRFDQAVEQAVFGVFRVLRDVRPQAFYDFGYCLQKFRLPGIAGGCLPDEFVKTLVAHSFSLARCVW